MSTILLLGYGNLLPSAWANDAHTLPAVPLDKDDDAASGGDDTAARQIVNALKELYGCNSMHELARESTLYPGDVNDKQS